MLKKKLVLALLAACCGMASAHAAVVVDAGAPDSGMHAFAAGGVVFNGVSDAELLGAEDNADASDSSTPLPNPYSMLLIGLVMLGFTSGRRHTEAFSPDP
ncbi:hypothetical protein [Janthinobacterium sp.]|uniref:hypothetical protein n=1 Tax=Janthinobacterium sp. TaxID=1871054 RepID=UPI00293D597F|nr:hypothetical protein [Janthinobacterium sp.]